MSTRSYVLVTLGYWAFTVTDGALRMLVLLHFHDLGYSPISIAFLFLLYEAMGVVTNLLGGWVGSRTGLGRTLMAGLALQVVALVGLIGHDRGWPEALSVAYVMGFQALSGVAKDLTKMSSKSAVKFVAGSAGKGKLFRLVALLTGSKNALKGGGFFVGAALLAQVGYDRALGLLAALIVVALAVVALLLDGDLGQAKDRKPITSILAKSSAVNRLSAARLFLFASRDIWFVVALPIFLSGTLGWSFEQVGAFLAAWVIGYGGIQVAAPRLLGPISGSWSAEMRAARRWGLALVAVSAAIAVAVALGSAPVVSAAVVGGLAVFGVVFAVNSSLHSYLILALSGEDTVSLDVGFYYSANAAGRLIGTLASGVLYLVGGLVAALWGTTVFAAVAWWLTVRLGRLPADQGRSGHAVESVGPEVG